MSFEIEKKDTDLKKAIIKVVAYFDMFDYPLTDFEVWKYLSVKYNFIEVKKILYLMSLRGSESDRSNLVFVPLTEIASPSARNDNLETKNGFYFFSGRNGIINARMARYNFADRKFKRALRVAKLFKLIPWIKMIAVGNIMGAHNLKDESDIDLFIITQNKRIWLARFFAAALMKILRLRPEEKNTRDKICLSFFVSEEEMDLKGLMIENDIYFIHWLAGLVPIFDVGDMYKKFIQENFWLNEFLPNWMPAEISFRRDAGLPFSKIYFKIIDLLFSRLENIFKKIQLRLFPTAIKELMNKDSRVVVGDNIIKTHIKDRRSEYRKNWEDRIKTFNN